MHPQQTFNQGVQKMSRQKWYVGNTGNHQGLVIEEETGNNICIVYDKANAKPIASAPDLLEALKEIRVKCLEFHSNNVIIMNEIEEILNITNTAIQETENN